MYDETTRAAYPFLARLEAAAPDLLAEVAALDEARWAVAQGYSDGVHVCVFEAGRFLHEFDAAAVERARADCPAAAAVVGTIEGVRLAGYQRFVHGAGMAVHTDPRANNMVRCILGLQLPTAEQAWWPPGRARLLDTRLPHWARNDDAAPRYTLVLDIQMPFPVDSSGWPPWRLDDPRDLARPAGDLPEAAFRAQRQLARGGGASDPGPMLAGGDAFEAEEEMDKDE